MPVRLWLESRLQPVWRLGIAGGLADGTAERACYYSWPCASLAPQWRRHPARRIMRKEAVRAANKESVRRYSEGNASIKAASGVKAKSTSFAQAISQISAVEAAGQSNTGMTVSRRQRSRLVPNTSHAAARVASTPPRAARECTVARVTSLKYHSQACGRSTNLVGYGAAHSSSPKVAARVNVRRRRSPSVHCQVPPDWLLESALNGVASRSRHRRGSRPVISRRIRTSGASQTTVTALKGGQASQSNCIQGLASQGLCRQVRLREKRTKTSAIPRQYPANFQEIRTWLKATHQASNNVGAKEATFNKYRSCQECTANMMPRWTRTRHAIHRIAESRRLAGSLAVIGFEALLPGSHLSTLDRTHCKIAVPVLSTGPRQLGPHGGTGHGESVCGTGRPHCESQSSRHAPSCRSQADQRACLLYRAGFVGRNVSLADGN